MEKEDNIEPGPRESRTHAILPERLRNGRGESRIAWSAEGTLIVGLTNNAIFGHLSCHVVLVGLFAVELVGVR